MFLIKLNDVCCVVGSFCILIMFLPFLEQLVGSTYLKPIKYSGNNVIFQKNLFFLQFECLERFVVHSLFKNVESTSDYPHKVRYFTFGQLLINLGLPCSCITGAVPLTVDIFFDFYAKVLIFESASSNCVYNRYFLVVRYPPFLSLCDQET